MKSKIILLTISGLILAGCASTPNNTQNHESPITNTTPTENQCPSTGAELNTLKSEENVVHCFGQPLAVTSKPDGLHTGLYKLKTGIIIVFLYDSNGSVIRHRAYKSNS